MPERVRQQVEQHALDLVGREARACASASTSASSVTCRARASASTPRRQTRRRPAPSGSRVQLERERAGVDPGELEEVVDEQRERRAPARASAGRYSSGLGEAVLERLEHRLHVRERRAQVVARPGDELAARVEEAARGSSAISLNDAASSASSAGPASGARAVEVAARELAGRVADAVDRAARSSARGRAPRSTRRQSPTRPTTARIFTSSPMWNITQPESEHGAEREADREERRARRAGAGRSGAARSSEREREPDAERGERDDDCAEHRSRHEPVADAPDGLRGGAAADGSSSIFSRSRRTWTVTVPVSSAAVVAPDALHQLVAREHVPRMARRGTRAGRTPSRSAAARLPALRTSRVAALELDVAEGERSPAASARCGAAQHACARARRARAARTAS